MKRIVLASLVLAGLVPVCSSAVEITNIRPCYGALGATRFERKILPGDIFFMTYDIGDLGIDAKTGRAKYNVTVELSDAQGKVVFSKETPNEIMPELGGATMPGDLIIETGPKQAPGKYTIKLTVEDKIGKNAKAFKYDFELLAPSFGMMHVNAPAIGLQRQITMPGCVLANLGLDAKKQPNATVTLRILDQGGKPVAPDIQKSYPRDLDGADLTKANLVLVEFPVLANRVGRFTVEMVAEDKISQRKTELRFPFTVIDINKYTGR